MLLQSKAGSEIVFCNVELFQVRNAQVHRQPDNEKNAQQHTELTPQDLFGQFTWRRALFGQVAYSAWQYNCVSDFFGRSIGIHAKGLPEDDLRAGQSLSGSLSSCTMEVIALQSGSSGNCVYVESGGVRLLFDAGISGRQAEERLAEHDKDIRDVDALIISHDHRDHTACMGVFHRKFGLPLFVTRPTFDYVSTRMKVGKVNDVRYFNAGETLVFDHVSVETFSTPHDAADGVVFVLDDSKHRFGLLTDLGHVFEPLPQMMPTLDAVFIESNYDIDMLEEGPYPAFLKERISGPHGHLSNEDAAYLLQSALPSKMKWACLAHLSDENNDPDVALRTHHEILGHNFPLKCADRRAATEILRLE
jgi:phosphoribosyl 1,2-cyclic phosphodiesterase